MIPMYRSSRSPGSSLLTMLFLSVSNTDTSFNFPAFLPCNYAYDSESRPTLRAVRSAFWKYLSRIRIWLPPWKQQLLPHLTPATHSQPVRHPLRLLTAITVRRERFQWKRKMVLRFLKPSETP